MFIKLLRPLAVSGFALLLSASPSHAAETTLYQIPWTDLKASDCWVVLDSQTSATDAATVVLVRCAGRVDIAVAQIPAVRK